MNEAAVERQGRTVAMDTLRAARLVGVVRVDDAAAAREIALAYLRGGINCVEITMTTPGAAGLITELADRFRSDPAILIGAGTVLTTDTARTALDAGARFLVAPCAPDLAPAAQEYGAVTVLGALTVTEILAALERGADLVKVFPVSAVGGPAYFRDIMAPLPTLPLWAAGGTTVAAIRDYLAAGVQVIGLAGSIQPAAAVRAGDWAAIENLARQATEALKAEF